MKEVKFGKIKLKDIKHIENSRLRENDDVSSLMYDIQQRGLLQPIGIRIDDNALIFGNRRVRAFEKLGYEEIECIFFSDINDEELLISNLVENIQRKNIGTIEIGRICKLLMEKEYTTSEIAHKLGINQSKVSSCIAAFNVTVGTVFEKLVTQAHGKSKFGGIPERLIWTIQNSIGRALGKKITKDQWNILLRAAEIGKLHGKNIPTLRYILLFDEKKDIVKALDILDKVKTLYIYLSVNREEYDKCKDKEKFTTDTDFIKHIFKSYNKDLLF